MVLNFLPMAEYPEDQENAKYIMYAHGFQKGIQTGSLVALVSGGFYALVRGKPKFPTMLKWSSVGIIVGPSIVIPMIAMKMNGKTAIEWQDRAWRLQRNEGQISVDTASDAGLIVGGLLYPLLSNFRVSLLQGAAVGCAANVVGYILITAMK